MITGFKPPANPNDIHGVHDPCEEQSIIRQATTSLEQLGFAFEYESTLNFSNSIGTPHRCENRHVARCLNSDLAVVILEDEVVERIANTLYSVSIGVSNLPAGYRKASDRAIADTSLKLGKEFLIAEVIDGRVAAERKAAHGNSLLYVQNHVGDKKGFIAVLNLPDDLNGLNVIVLFVDAPVATLDYGVTAYAVLDNEQIPSDVVEPTIEVEHVPESLGDLIVRLAHELNVLTVGQAAG